MFSAVPLVLSSLTLVFAVSAGAQDAAPQNPLDGNREALAAGTKRFQEGCALCHGANAEGGRGPALVKNFNLFRMDDKKLFDIIEHGIPGTGMPPSNLPDKNVWELTTFVRSLSSPANDAIVEGNAKLGHDLFFGAGNCSSCHAILGKGGSIGPDLSNAGEFTVADLRESITDPNKEIAHGFGHVTITLESGETRDGVAKANSDYALLLLDRQGQLHAFDKASLREIVSYRESLMPKDIAQRLGPVGVQNLIAFLAQQTARPHSRFKARGQQGVQ